MMDVYEKIFSFILSILTRWGIQINMIESVSRNCQALQELCEDAR